MNRNYSTYLVRNLAILITMDKDMIYSHVDLLIEDGVVKRISPTGMIKKEKGVKVIDGEGKIGLPGFINTHSHSTQFFLGGCLREMTIFKWLRILNEAYSHVNEKILLESTILHYLNMLRQGVTYVFDMEPFSDPIYNGAREVGLRVNYNMLLYNVPETACDHIYPIDSIQESIDENYKGYINLLNMKAFKKDMVEFSLGPVGFPASDNKLLQIIKDYSEKYNLRVHIHVGESKHNFNLCKRIYGCTEIENLYRLGLLNNNLHIAHGVWITEDDLALMSKYDVGLSHNSLSNSYLRVGTVDLHNYRRYGVKIGIGMDGVASNPVQSIFDEMKSIYYIQRSVKRDYPGFTAKDILYIATKIGAKIVGRDDLGFINEGSKADLVLLKMNDIQYPYFDDVYSHILFTASPNNVSEVFVNGRLLVEDSLLNIDIDYHEFVEDIRHFSSSICQGLEEELWF